MVEQEVSVPVTYETLRLNCAFRIDLLIERELIVELKAVSEILAVHKAQMLTYLRFSRKRLGLLINFGELHLKNGIYRIVN